MSESTPIQWLNPGMEHSGFSQDQLVIYKLGQIESQLAALLVKMADNSTQFQKDLLEVTAVNLELSKRVKNLEEFINAIKNRFIAAAAIISFLVVTAKVAITQWLN